MNDKRFGKLSGHQPEYQIGIDLGGTKAEIILLSKDGRELFRNRVATPVDTENNYKSVLESIESLVNQALDVVSPTDDYSVGIGIPGTMDKKTGQVQNANTTWLAGHYFKADLEKKLGKEIFMENDEQTPGSRTNRHPGQEE